MNVREALTHGDTPSLRARRRVAAIAAALAADFAVIGMRQYGVIRHLPDLPGKRFDSNAVITSAAGYPFGVPDSAFVVTGLGAIIVLATARGTRRSGRGRWLDVLLAGAVAVGAVGATYYVREMFQQRRLCAYCIAGASGFFAMVPALHGVLKGD